MLIICFLLGGMEDLLLPFCEGTTQTSDSKLSRLPTELMIRYWVLRISSRVGKPHDTTFELNNMNYKVFACA